MVGRKEKKEKINKQPVETLSLQNFPLYNWRYGMHVVQRYEGKMFIHIK